MTDTASLSPLLAVRIMTEARRIAVLYTATELMKLQQRGWTWTDCLEEAIRGMHKIDTMDMNPYVHD